MSDSVLMIGGGDVGIRIADSLLRQGTVRNLTVGDLDSSPAVGAVAMLSECHEALVEFEHVDGLDRSSIERVILQSQPDLIIQTASLISPWTIIGKEHPTARALSSAGIAVQLPAQLPIVLNVMHVVAELGLSVPVANMSMPDIIHPILAELDLAPAIGLGNASIMHLRVRAALRARISEQPAKETRVRIVGHHNHVYGVMQAAPPSNEDDRVRVHLGERGKRADLLAYEGTKFPAGPIYNVITAASALPVLSSLLPGGNDLLFSAPAPQGLPGGYPVRIESGEVSVDLPVGVELEDAISFNQRIGRKDGVAEVGKHGIVHFTDAVGEAVRHIDPSLSEPFEPERFEQRTMAFMKMIRENLM